MNTEVSDRDQNYSCDAPRVPEGLAQAIQEFKLVAVVGEGTFGKVLKEVHARTRQKVALKVVAFTKD